MFTFFLCLKNKLSKPQYKERLIGENQDNGYIWLVCKISQLILFIGFGATFLKVCGVYYWVVTPALLLYGYIRAIVWKKPFVIKYDSLLNPNSKLHGLRVTLLLPHYSLTYVGIRGYLAISHKQSFLHQFSIHKYLQTLAFSLIVGIPPFWVYTFYHYCRIFIQVPRPHLFFAVEKLLFETFSGWTEEFKVALLHDTQVFCITLYKLPY